MSKKETNKPAAIVITDPMVNADCMVSVKATMQKMVKSTATKHKMEEGEIISQLGDKGKLIGACSALFQLVKSSESGKSDGKALKAQILWVVLSDGFTVKLEWLAKAFVKLGEGQTWDKVFSGAKGKQMVALESITADGKKVDWTL